MSAGQAVLEDWDIRRTCGSYSVACCLNMHCFLTHDFFQRSVWMTPTVKSAPKNTRP